MSNKFEYFYILILYKDVLILKILKFVSNNK